MVLAAQNEMKDLNFTPPKNLHNFIIFRLLENLTCFTISIIAAEPLEQLKCYATLRFEQEFIRYAIIRRLPQ